MRPVTGTRLFALMLCVLVSTGCSALLPKQLDSTRQPWNSFEETQACFDTIVVQRTTLADLRTMGLDPLTSANMKMLSYVDLVARFVPHSGIRREDLDPDLRTCLEVQDGCSAYELILDVRSSKRTGSVFLDLFGFRRTTHITGWTFTGLLVLKDETVVFKLRTGEPHVDRTEQRIRPLGPLQELDNVLGEVATGAI